MRDNWETQLRGEQCLLVPYRRRYVKRYHEWMQDPWIREMTASEPLSLQEEYSMQESWHLDDKKCTFIVLHAATLDKSTATTTSRAKADGTAASFDEVEVVVKEEKEEEEEEGGSSSSGGSSIGWGSSMAGDVNLFFNDYEDEHACEIEIMIAEEKFRGRGMGREALVLMMQYAAVHLQVSRFYAKIGDANKASHALFAKLGYVKRKYVAAFKETELEFVLDEASRERLRGWAGSMQLVIQPYSEEKGALADPAPAVSPPSAGGGSGGGEGQGENGG